MKVGVVGLGGLGHMAVKWAKAFGCEVRLACACLSACLPALSQAVSAGDGRQHWNDASGGARPATATTTAIASARPPARLPTPPAHSPDPLPASTHPVSFCFSARRSPSSPPAPTRRQRPWRAWEPTTLLSARTKRRWRRPQAPCMASSTPWQVGADNLRCFVCCVSGGEVHGAVCADGACTRSWSAVCRAPSCPVLQLYCLRCLWGSMRGALSSLGATRWGYNLPHPHPHTSTPPISTARLACSQARAVHLHAPAAHQRQVCDRGCAA